MNNVHEQCPKSDSGTVPSPKTGWVHQVHSLLAQPAHPGAHRHVRSRVAAWPPGHVAGTPAPCRSARAAVSQAPSGRIVGAGRRVVAWPLGRVATQCLPHALAHVTIHLGVLRYNFFSSQAAHVTIQQLYRDTSPASSLSGSQYTKLHCNIVSPAAQNPFLANLQYNFFFLLQYSPSNYTPKVAIQFFYHNTIGQ